MHGANMKTLMYVEANWQVAGNVQWIN